ncbi:MAG: hypothetical protein WD069_01885 [Planctomycetales bacterium]
MKEHDFTIILGGIAEFSDDDLERLFEAGCDDCLPVSRDGVAMLRFGREAESFVAAVSSAMRDLGRSGVGTVVRVTADAAEHKADADEINRTLALLERVDREDVREWPVGHASA